jgi:CheY-like chemotaxis protein
METCLIDLPLSRSTDAVAPIDSVELSPTSVFLVCDDDSAFERIVPRVLLVGHDSTTTTLLAEALTQSFDCFIDCAAHGVEALELAAVERYALVISATDMPMMSGFELYLWLQEAQPITAQRLVFVADEPMALENLQSVPMLMRPIAEERVGEICGRLLESGLGLADPSPGLHEPGYLKANARERRDCAVNGVGLR